MIGPVILGGSNPTRPDVDEYTTFLMRDTLIDDSRFHNQIYISGVNYNPCGITSSNIKMHDNRNSIIFGCGSWIVLGTPGIINLAGDYTIEYWRFLETNAASSATCNVRSRFDTRLCSLLVANSDISVNASLYVSNSTNGWDVLNNKSMGNYSANNWYHTAVSKSGNTYYCFQDGVLKNTYTGATPMTISTVRLFAIGGYFGSANSFAANGTISGYLQDFRVSNICRYTSNFTPPERL